LVTKQESDVAILSKRQEMGAYDHLPPALRHVLAYNDNGGLSPYKLLMWLQNGQFNIHQLITLCTDGRQGKFIIEPEIKPNRQERRRAYNRFQRQS
jgi:hypothetical protein